jgi:hypothetical protein
MGLDRLCRPVCAIEMDQLTSWVFGAVPCCVDVRLDGKRRGFDFTSSVWTGAAAGVFYSSFVEALVDECVQMSKDAGYGDFRPSQFFAYVETTQAGEIMQLVRLEEAGNALNSKWQSGESVNIRVQMWSDESCDAALVDGDQSSLNRMKTNSQLM